MEKIRIGEDTITVRSRRQPTRYLLAKLHKDPIAFRSITTCFATTTESVSKLVHACLAGMLPTLHALWREALAFLLGLLLTSVGLQQVVM